MHTVQKTCLSYLNVPVIPSSLIRKMLAYRRRAYLNVPVTPSSLIRKMHAYRKRAYLNVPVTQHTEDVPI